MVISLQSGFLLNIIPILNTSYVNIASVIKIQIDGKTMEEISTLEKLGQKVTQMIQNYEAVRAENAQLKESLERLQLDYTSKEATITEMQDELLEKEMEIEEIVNKIESILG